jgi:phosphatidylserine decarboxylase
MIYSAAFLRRYHHLPHGFINQSFALLMRARWPRWLVRRAISGWIERDGIDMQDFEARPFLSLEDFFLRDLRPGARPLGAGLVSPVDGRVVALGRIEPSAQLHVKGHCLSLERLVNGAGAATPERPALSLERYRGGHYVSIFLSPRGYHYVHMPAAGVVHEARWLAGRFFPQNEIALRHIPDVYEQNERLVLNLTLHGMGDALLVMVGASLIGGIQLALAPRPMFTRRRPLALEAQLAKGQRLGHFTFGSTVVLLLPPSAQPRCALGADVHMGEALCS